MESVDSLHESKPSSPRLNRVHVLKRVKATFICWELLMQTCTMSRWRSMLEAWCNSYKATGKSDEIFSPSAALQGGGLQEAKHNQKQKKVKKKVQGIWKSEIRRFVRFWGQRWIWATWVSTWSLILRSTGDWIYMNLHEFRWTNNVLFSSNVFMRSEMQCWKSRVASKYGVPDFCHELPLLPVAINLQ